MIRTLLAVAAVSVLGFAAHANDMKPAAPATAPAASTAPADPHAAHAEAATTGGDMKPAAAAPADENAKKKHAKKKDKK